MKGISLKSLNRRRARPASMGVDELQGLLLQISFAIMIVFMMAYFLFRSDARKRQEEQLLEIERQKLVIAVEAADAEMRARYGLDAIEPALGQSAPAVFIDGDSLTSDPGLRAAFLKAMRTGIDDLSDQLALRRRWIDRVLELARVGSDSLSRDSLDWLSRQADDAVARYADSIRRSQFHAASELQRFWMDNPSSLDDPAISHLLSELEGAGEERRLLVVTELRDTLERRALETLMRLTAQ